MPKSYRLTGNVRGVTAMNAINENAFAILGSSTLCSGLTAFALWGVTVGLIALI